MSTTSIYKQNMRVQKRKDYPILTSVKSRLRVATRTSNLAIRQVAEVFSHFPQINYEIVPIQSYGDQHKEMSLIGNKIENFFTRELDEALLSGLADIAVHSAKDLPYPLPDGLEVIALLEAFDKTDSIVSHGNRKLLELPKNFRLGTSSLLRKSELLKLRDDVQIVSIRGTIEERISQVENGSVDAVVVATCALKRLGLENRIAEVLPFETHPLQGHLAVVAKTGQRKLKHFFGQKDIHSGFGKVWLVGFGPGNPDLITVKGRKVLKQADVIFYDDLLNKEFLTKFKAEKIYVGKRKGNHSIEQDEINRLLYNAAVSGKTVVRLKGGDPMLFAHGGEEIEYMRRYLVEVEVVPGITAALAAAAYTGIPLTQRGISSSVAFITGHSAGNITVPQTGTLVYYMGASNINSIAKEVINQGWHPDTPVLMLYDVSGKNQQQFYTTLQEAMHDSKTYKTPLLIVIGEVVRLKTQTSENIRKPIFLVTGTTSGNFSKMGEVVHVPLIEIKPLTSYNHLLQVIDDIPYFQWLIFTSRYAVRYFFDALLEFGKDIRLLSGLKIASIGATTTQELRKLGILPDLQPVNESSNGLIELFLQKGIKGQNILIPRSNIGLPVLPEGLKHIGNSVTTVAIYENVKPKHIPSKIPAETDYVVFSSPSCIDNFFEIYGECESFTTKKFIVQGEETYEKLIGFGISHLQILKKEEYASIS